MHETFKSRFIQELLKSPFCDENPLTFSDINRFLMAFQLDHNLDQFEFY